VPRPELRSSLAKEQLKAIDELGSEQARKIREQIPRDSLAHIEASSRVDWLPLDVMVALIDTVWNVLGAEGAPRFWRRTTMRLFDTPLIKTVAQGVVSLFNPSPASALQVVPKLNKLLYRDTGEMLVETVSTSEVRIVYEGTPEMLLKSPGWRPSLTASYLATLDFLKAPNPDVSSVVEKDRVIFTLKWRVSR
jgi:hypothetical protein